MEFIPPAQRMLQWPARRVVVQDICAPEIQRVCDELHEFAAGKTAPNKHGSRLVGVAAPQVGIDLAIVYVDLAKPDGWGDKLRLMINPEIVRVWGDDEPVVWWHGCFSTDKLVTVQSLPRYMEVAYYDRQGERHTWIIDGVVDGARQLHVVWHEIEHIYGRRHVDAAVNRNQPVYVVWDDERAAFFDLFMAGRHDLWFRRLPAAGWAAMRAGRDWRGLIIEQSG